jgi:hypothetical protein
MLTTKPAVWSFRNELKVNEHGNKLNMLRQIFQAQEKSGFHALAVFQNIVLPIQWCRYAYMQILSALTSPLIFSTHTMCVVRSTTVQQT